MAKTEYIIKPVNGGFEVHKRVYLFGLVPLTFRVTHPYTTIGMNAAEALIKHLTRAEERYDEKGNKIG